MKIGLGVGIEFLKAPTTSAAALAWRDKVVANGGTVSAGRLALIDEWIFSDTDIAAILLKMDFLNIYTAENAGSALTSLVGSFLHTAVNSPTFTADSYYAGNGTSSYLNCNYTPSTEGVNFVQDSACFGVMQNNSANDQYHGGYNGVVGVRLHTYTGSEIAGFINGLISEANFGAVVNGVGLSVIQREDSLSRGCYKNGVRKTFGNSASSGVSDKSLMVGAENTNGTAADFSTAQLVCSFAGSQLTNAEHLALYTAIRGYCLEINSGLAI